MLRMHRALTLVYCYLLYNFMVYVVLRMETTLLFSFSFMSPAKVTRVYPKVSGLS